MLGKWIEKTTDLIKMNYFRGCFIYSSNILKNASIVSNIHKYNDDNPSIFRNIAEYNYNILIEEYESYQTLHKKIFGKKDINMSMKLEKFEICYKKLMKKINNSQFEYMKNIFENKYNIKFETFL